MPPATLTLTCLLIRKGSPPHRCIINEQRVAACTVRKVFWALGQSCQCSAFISNFSDAFHCLTSASFPPLRLCFSQFPLKMAFPSFPVPTLPSLAWAAALSQSAGGFSPSVKSTAFISTLNYYPLNIHGCAIRSQKIYL